MHLPNRSQNNQPAQFLLKCTTPPLLPQKNEQEADQQPVKDCCDSITNQHYRALIQNIYVQIEMTGAMYLK